MIFDLSISFVVTSKSVFEKSYPFTSSNLIMSITLICLFNLEILASNKLETPNP